MIELSGVTKRFPRRNQPDVVALDNISLTVPTGQIHAIVGQSGAGKSTLIRCITALEQPTTGSISIDGQPLTGLSAAGLRDVRRKIAMVFQGGNLLDQRTAGANVAYPMAIAGVPKEQRRGRVEELLGLVGLADRAHAYPSELSGGQRQRVAIARALATTPDVLVCDEPTSALDTATTDQILNLLRTVRDRYGITILIITHEMAVVRKIADAVTLLQNGRAIASGTLTSILSDMNSPLARRLVPLPSIGTNPNGTVVDIAFTATPGEPNGSRAIDLATRLGADIAAGSFESLPEIQFARLALVFPASEVDRAVAQLSHAGLAPTVRQTPVAESSSSGDTAATEEGDAE